MQSSEQAVKVSRPTESIPRHTLSSGQRLNHASNPESQDQVTGFSAHSSLTNITYRPTQSSSGAPAPVFAITTDSSWPGNQTPVRGNVQFSVPGHAMFQPHMCYGYMPSYHGFMNAPYNDYITFGKFLILQRLLRAWGSESMKKH